MGVNFETHDSSVALIKDDEILFAAAEERFSRIKMDDSAPILAIQECLKQTGLKPDDINIVAISGFPPMRNWWVYAKSFIVRKTFCKGKDFKIFVRRIKGEKLVFKRGGALIVNSLFCTGVPQFLFLYLTKRIRVGHLLKGFKGKFVYTPHHYGHAASACFTSGFSDALSIVIEGYDWENSIVIDEFENGDFKQLTKTSWPHSPGMFYELATTILGFDYLKHAGKITGLAAFGDPNVVYDKVAALIWSNGVTLEVNPLIYGFIQDYYLSNQIPGYFANCLKEDIAAAFQKRLEDVLIDLLKNALKITNKRKIVLSGGVAANVLLNQKIHEIEGVEEIYIHPAMSDAGQALGAAQYAYNQELKKQGKYLPSKCLKNVYFGSGYSDEEIKYCLDKQNIKYCYYDDIERKIARLLADKKIVARYNGRMEYGPRALGNRSILFHAGDKTANDWLNSRLKRTEFMPFAPSVLMEDRFEYFLNIQGAEYTAEFMTITFNCTNKMKQECPAVVHIDGTARPNFVSKETNPSYYRIIKEYKNITGIGVILNTSFNMHEEPIVCTPEEAIRAFKQSGLDYLAISCYLVQAQ